MTRAEELLVQQMELLHEQAKEARTADDAATLTAAMCRASAEMRDIASERATYVRVATAAGLANRD